MQILICICAKNPKRKLVDNIRTLINFYPNSKIVIIDSDSSDFSTYEIIENEFIFQDVEIHYIKNKNMEVGAYVYAYEKYNKYDYYIFQQDSIYQKEYIPLIHDVYSMKCILGFKGLCYYDQVYQIMKDSKYSELILKLKNYRKHRFFLTGHNTIIINRKILPNFVEFLKDVIDRYNKMRGIGRFGDICERISGIYFTYHDIDTYQICDFYCKEHGKRL